MEVKVERFQPKIENLNRAMMSLLQKRKNSVILELKDKHRVKEIQFLSIKVFPLDLTVKPYLEAAASNFKYEKKAIKEMIRKLSQCKVIKDFFVITFWIYFLRKYPTFIEHIGEVKEHKEKGQMVNGAKADQDSSEDSFATEFDSKSSQGQKEEVREQRFSEIGSTLKFLKNKVTYEKSKKLQKDIQNSIQEAQQYYQLMKLNEIPRKLLAPRV